MKTETETNMGKARQRRCIRLIWLHLICSAREYSNEYSLYLAADNSLPLNLAAREAASNKQERASVVSQPII